jgi:hypothetical protein
MANQIIDNLLVSGAIMRGIAFKDLSSKFQDVLARRKVDQKAITDFTQTKEMRYLYKTHLRTKYDCLIEDENPFFIADWANYTTC